MDERASIDRCSRKVRSNVYGSAKQAMPSEELFMIPWVLLDTARIPGDRGDLRLKRRGAEFSIMLGSNELMKSRLSGSEEALGKLSCLRLRGRERPQILIGGLGMGFTL